MPILSYFRTHSDVQDRFWQILCPSFSAAEWNDAVPCPGRHLMHLYIAHETRQSVWPILSTGILKLGRMRTFAGVTIFIMRKQDGTIEYIDIINIIMIIITSQGKSRFVDSIVWLHPKNTAENPPLSSFFLFPWHIGPHYPSRTFLGCLRQLSILPRQRRTAGGTGDPSV